MMGQSRVRVLWFDLLRRHALHHTALDNLKLQRDVRSEGSGSGYSHCAGHRSHTHLVVVPSLLDEPVHDLLGLLVTFQLQVSDQSEQVTGAIVRLHDRLVRLHDPSDACKHVPARSVQDRTHTHTHLQSHLLVKASVYGQI